MPRKVFVDSGVFLLAFKGKDDPQRMRRAFELLDDPANVLCSSEFVWLELMPMATHRQEWREVYFFEKVFGRVKHWAKPIERIVSSAEDEATVFGLNALDALHVAAARRTRADLLVTTEKKSKPIHQVGDRRLRVVGI